ncbi:MAG: hypothetical protein IPQ08_06180 [Chitinophagaceae bacterium]|nr:hypothetical protein [Chitinophagaceae bacterium]
MKFIDDSGIQKTKLQESNRKNFVAAQQKVTKQITKEACDQHGITESVLDFSGPDFSIKKFREGAYSLTRSLREANSELQFGQLLRAGVQNIFNDIYQSVEVTYDAAVREAGSNKRQEFYAPLERAGFPKRVERGAPFPETSFKGLDLELINLKWGVMLAIEKELIDDDMTGQIVQRAQQLAENARIFENAYVWTRMFNKSGVSLDGEPLPLSSTYATPYADATAGGIHGSGRGVNSLATASSARLSQSSIQAGWILAKKMLDQSGRPMAVLPSILAVSPQDIFFAETLMGSDYNPSKASTATGDDGKVSGNMSINPIKQLVGIVADRFIADYGAMLIDAGKGFVFQRRDATELVQENPTSGPAFSQEVFRYKERARWEADFIDPKFMINLNPTFAST